MTHGSSSRPPWHDVPIYPGCDLASDELWELSAALARAKREIAKSPPRLPKARRASVSLIAAALAAAAPALSSAHSGPGGKASAATRSWNRPLLKLGDRGAAVARLQRALGIRADGVFGPKTLRAVRSLQAREGLTVDGIVGPRTRAALARGGGERGRASVLELGDRGAAVARLQRALGIRADGVFGPKTLRAVRSLQAREGLTADGIVGPRTRAALAGGGGEREPSHSHEPDETAEAVSGIDGRLAGALARARELGLTLLSAYRPGATIAASGRLSDHSYFPSKAIDITGPAAGMRRYALAVAGMAGVETVIYSPLGIWTPGDGWHAIRTDVTYRDHLDHVHVDTF